MTDRWYLRFSLRILILGTTLAVIICAQQFIARDIERQNLRLRVLRPLTRMLFLRDPTRLASQKTLDVFVDKKGWQVHIPDDSNAQLMWQDQRLMELTTGRHTLELSWQQVGTRRSASARRDFEYKIVVDDQRELYPDITVIKDLEDFGSEEQQNADVGKPLVIFADPSGQPIMWIDSHK